MPSSIISIKDVDVAAMSAETGIPEAAIRAAFGHTDKDFLRIVRVADTLDSALHLYNSALPDSPGEQAALKRVCFFIRKELSNSGITFKRCRELYDLAPPDSSAKQVTFQAMLGFADTPELCRLILAELERSHIKPMRCQKLYFLALPGSPAGKSVIKLLVGSYLITK